jgi:hypothetical protein
VAIKNTPAYHDMVTVWREKNTALHLRGHMLIGKMYLTSYEQEMNQQQEAINTNCINHTQDWTLENTHSHKELLKYGTI